LASVASNPSQMSRDRHERPSSRHTSAHVPLPDSLVARVKQGLGFVFDFRLKAGLLPRLGVFAIKHRAATEQNETCFHADLSKSANQSDAARVFERKRWRVSGKLCRVMANGLPLRRFTDSFTDSGHSDAHKPLMHTHLRMEPVVGIEPTTDGLQNRCSTAELNWRQSQHNCIRAARAVKGLSAHTVRWGVADNK
jgi:hypothetical protein